MARKSTETLKQEYLDAKTAYETAFGGSGGNFLADAPVSVNLQQLKQAHDKAWGAYNKRRKAEFKKTFVSSIKVK